MVNLKYSLCCRHIITHFTGIPDVQMVLFFVNPDIRRNLPLIITLVAWKTNFLVNNIFMFLHGLLTSFEITHFALKCLSYVDIFFVCIQWAYAGILLAAYVTSMRNSLVSVFHVKCVIIRRQQREYLRFTITRSIVMNLGSIVNSANTRQQNRGIW